MRTALPPQGKRGRMDLQPAAVRCPASVPAPQKWRPPFVTEYARPAGDVAAPSFTRDKPLISSSRATLLRLSTRDARRRATQAESLRDKSGSTLLADAAKCSLALEEPRRVFQPDGDHLPGAQGWPLAAQHGHATTTRGRASVRTLDATICN